MCGIAGYFLAHDGKRPDLALMSAMLAHRGPDGSGLFEEGCVGLAHRRLAIIDLTATGHQPMTSADGTLVITYNGEIYNYLELREQLRQHGHAFIGSSDTEVILAAYRQWGGDCVSRFNGMWALAIWDRQLRRLFCSRDRFGVKPFYYLHKNGVFAFASEPKALLAAFPDERQPDWGTLNRFLSTSVMMEGERSFYKSIRLLRPAHSMVLNEDGLRSARYWSYPQPDARRAALPSATLAEEFRSLFIDAVRLRARSDVEVGTTLSGGLDSTAIVGAYRHIYPEIPHKSYSAVFDGSPHDESEYIDAVAGHERLQTYKIAQTSAGLLQDMRELVRALDSPLVSPATVPLHRVLKFARANGTTVLYDGQGADELLAGYDNQFYPPYLHSLLKSGLAMSPHMARALAGITRARALWTLRDLAPWTHPLYRRLIASDQVLSAGFRAQAEEESPPTKQYDDPLNEALYQAHSHRILPGLLHYGDGVSMASAVEYRLPFMDYRLVEFGFTLPAPEKMGYGSTKHILRQAMKGLMIDKVRLRRWKNGFHTPIQSWIAETPELVDSTVRSSTLRRHGVFDPAALHRSVDRALTGRNERLSQHILRWMTTELWLQECIDRPTELSHLARPNASNDALPRGVMNEAPHALHAPGA